MTEPRLNHVQCLDSRGLHRMAYWEWGDVTNSRVLVCAHGLSRQGRDFDTFAQAMTDRYRVVCPDVVGRGQSDCHSAVPMQVRAADRRAAVVLRGESSGRLDRRPAAGRFCLVAPAATPDVLLLARPKGPSKKRSSGTTTSIMARW